MIVVLDIPLSVILLLINFLLPILGNQLHDQQANEEAVEIFRVKYDPDHIYEVVPVVAKFANSRESERHAYRGSSADFPKHSVYVEIFGERYDLYLEENNGILFGDRTPIIIPYIDSRGNIHYDKRNYDIIPQLKMGIYHDRNKRAAFTVHEDDDGRIHVNGIINNTFIIRSIPKGLHEEVLSKHPNLPKPSHISNETENIHKHIVIKKNVENGPENVEFKFTPSRLKTGHRNKRSPSLNYNRGFTVYPKILLILDYATYLFHGGNLAQCILYTIAYWNVVDLRFREMENPSIRLNVAGIIVAMDPSITPYMDKHKESDTSRYDQETLEDLESYFAKEPVDNINYDIVAAISPWKIIESVSFWQRFKNFFTGSKPSDRVAGITYERSICDYPRQAMVLVKDGGRLVDMNPNNAAHEIAHVLGAHHDPKGVDHSDPNYQSRWENGYIMSYEHINYNQMHWSDHSLRAIQRNLQTHKGNRCLLKKPYVGEPYRKLLPGKILNRDELCKFQFGDKSYSSENPLHLGDCMGSYCWSSDEQSYMRVNRPVAEGSYCGHRKICIEGECVRDHTDSKVYRSL